MSAIKCPECGTWENKVIDSRTSIDGYIEIDYYIRRRRICHSCNKRFTTIEITLKTFNQLMKGGVTDESSIHNSK